MHYVCLGMGELNDKPGYCQTESCPRFGQLLAECECTDGQHKSAFPPEAQSADSSDHHFEEKAKSP